MVLSRTPSISTTRSSSGKRSRTFQMAKLESMEVYVWKKVKTKLENGELLESITTSTRELAHRMLEQVDAVEESEDVPQAEQLLRTMKFASDLKKWMED